MELLLISFLAFISALVTSIFGFGAGLVLTPLLSFFMPLKQAIGISAFIFLFTSGSKLLWYFKDTDWKQFRFAFSISLIGLACGFVLLRDIDPFWLEKIYAVMLIYFGYQALRNKSAEKSIFPPTIYPVMGGFFSALIHGGGAFFIRLCRMNGLDRIQTVATVAAIHFAMNIIKTIFFAGTQVVSAHYIVTLAPAYIAAIIGTRIGRTVLKRYVNEKVFSCGIGLLLQLLALKYLF